MGIADSSAHAAEIYHYHGNGFNISDDDEEEFHPATDDNDADKENDNYILDLDPEIIPLPDNIYVLANMETSLVVSVG